MNGLETNREPVVVIIGRPNVGKSTFFNRLIRTRKAITDPTPGVTRDPVSHLYEKDGLRIRLVDTGGLKWNNEGLDSLVTARSLKTAADADLIVVLFDAMEVTGEDEELIELCRPYSDKLMTVVNKVDSPAREASACAYYAYGFSTLYKVSAEHNIGIDEWEDALAARLREMGFKPSDSVSEQESEEDQPLRIVILGQPNTGKSTLTNLLTGRESSLVSDIPGTTRDIVEGTFRFMNRNFSVSDTAGIRRKRSVGENIEYYSVNRAIASIAGSDIVFLMIDAEKGLSEQDKKIAAQAVNRGKGIILVLNKWDLMPQHRDAVNSVTDRIRFLFPVLSFAPIVTISAKENRGISRLLKTALEMEKQFHNKVSTNRLNTALSEWLYENPIPARGRIKYKVKYLTQLSTAPVKFAVFVNRKKGFPETWLQYMINRIRSVFGFRDVPIRIEIKESRKGDKS